ncbi:hypothetical protein [Paenibacillus pinihumi]|uniref:hypothetical protein n=1 Tax=Paenibacillus pinihumi TaxID=669462 RepID=UPI0003FF7E1A|nr:hypothetical protein [Paenibacillus pinihumi]
MLAAQLTGTIKQYNVYDCLDEFAEQTPYEPQMMEMADKFMQVPKMLFLSHKPHHELSGYIRKLSVLLIPFLPTPASLATNPVKAYEYLASGKPVVSTALPGCMLMQPHVDVCRSGAQFIDTVLLRLRDPGDCAGTYVGRAHP